MPATFTHMSNMYEICLWLSDNPNILQMANQVYAMKNMPLQNSDNAQMVLPTQQTAQVDDKVLL